MGRIVEIKQLISKLHYLVSSRSTMELTVHFLTFYLKCLGIYPLSSVKKNKPWLFYPYRLLWWFYLANQLALLLPTFYAFFANFDSVVSTSNSLTELSCMLENVFLLYLFKRNEDEIESLLDNAKREISKRQRIPLDNRKLYLLVFALMMLAYFVLIYLYIYYPDSTGGNKIITSALYTFSVEAVAVRSLLYCNQLIALFHVSLTVFGDGIFGLLMYVCSARLKIFERGVRQRRFEALRDRVREHQSCLSLIERSARIVRFIVLKTVFSYVVNSIAAAIQISNETLLTSQFVHQITLLVVVFLRIIACTESAQSLLNTANNLETATVNNSLASQNKSFKTIDKVIIIARCQRLPRIRVNGFMTSFDKRFLAHVFISTCSYFTAIRAIVNKK